MLAYIQQKFDQLEQFGAEVIMDKRQGLIIKLLQSVLVFLSCLFGLIVKARLFLHKNRLIKSRSLGCMVIVVGNLTVGGTGKTPVVEMVARQLTAKGRKVAILSRGYKSKSDSLFKRFWKWLTHAKATPPKVVSDGQTIFLRPEISGDEPFMLAQNLPGVVVVVDKDRVKAGRYAIEKFGVDTLVLDDGFQYLRLKGKHNFLLIDTTNPFGNHWLLPRGILREPVAHLKRASYIFLTKSSNDTLTRKNIEHTIRRYAPKVKIVECAHTPKCLYSINNGHNEEPLSIIKGKRVALFSGIAVPESFEQLIFSLGAKIGFTERFADHHLYLLDEMQDFFNKAEEQKVDFILTTEKDAVRIPKILKSPVPMYYLRLEISIVDGVDNFEDALSQICI